MLILVLHRSEATFHLGESVYDRLILFVKLVLLVWQVRVIDYSCTYDYFWIVRPWNHTLCIFVTFSIAWIITLAEEDPLTGLQTRGHFCIIAHYNCVDSLRLFTNKSWLRLVSSLLEQRIWISFNCILSPDDIGQFDLVRVTWRRLWLFVIYFVQGVMNLIRDRDIILLQALLTLISMQSSTKLGCLFEYWIIFESSKDWIQHTLRNRLLLLLFIWLNQVPGDYCRSIPDVR